MSAKLDDLIAERARALGIVHLTRRSDLRVSEPALDLGLDFLVYLDPADAKGLRQFGVSIKASRSPATETELNETLRPYFRTIREAGAFPFPVCLFYFTMIDDRAYFSWVTEPVIEAGPRPLLRMQQEPQCQTLDRPALDRLIEQINQWYDVFFTTVAA